jgi:predicted nucleic acid-binding protein
MSVFADTSGLYALLVGSEEGHAGVVRAFRNVVAEQRPLRTTSYVVVETVALLQRRVGLEAVRDFDDHVFPMLSVEWVSDELHRRGMRRVSRENRRRLSLVDCVSLEFMRQRAIEDVLGLDRHFEEAGYALLCGTGGG